MKIVVLLKQTPDTESKIKIDASGSAIDHADTKYIINPYDEFAIEEALQTKEKAGGTPEVIIMSFGDDKARELIIKGLAMGGDRGVLISNAGLESADSLTVAKVLAAAVKTEGASLVLCGRQAIDDDNMHVGTMTAELLGWPHVNVVTKLTLTGEKAHVEREVEGGKVEVYDVNLPAVIGAHKSLNTPRYASLPGIMKAKKKPFDAKTPGDYGINASEIKTKIKVAVKSYEYPPAKPAGRLFQGEELEVMTDKVVQLLRQEAKVL